MLVKFPRVKFLETEPSFRKRKKISLSRVYVPLGNSRPSRTVTVKKCNKKCNARVFLTLSLPSSFLKAGFHKDISISISIKVSK